MFAIDRRLLKHVHLKLLFNNVEPDPCLSDPCDINADCKREGLLSELFNCTCIPPFEGTGFNCSSGFKLYMVGLVNYYLDFIT